MGFFMRKSVKVGPFRFNLSGSGMSVSTGIRGLRFGTGPRGNYVHMGAGGHYYRTSLTDGETKGKKSDIENKGNEDEGQVGKGLEIIESGSVLEMIDSNSTDLLAEINNKMKRMSFWPITAVLFLLLAYLLFNNNVELITIVQFDSFTVPY